MKLVFDYFWKIPNVSSGITTIPFEYSSKEDFKTYVYDKIKKYKNSLIADRGIEYGELYYKDGEILLFTIVCRIGDLEFSVENYLYEFDEWFEKQKEII